MYGPENWTSDIAKAIDATDDTVSLTKYIPELWHWRYYKDALKYAMPRAREKMERLHAGYTGLVVVAVDISGIFHACLHNKKLCKGVYEKMRWIYKDVEPDVFIIAADGGRSKEWKESRDPHPPEYDEMVAECKQYFLSKGIQWEEHEGREADDVMASIAFTCQVLGCQCVLVTEDSDLYQVLGSKTAIYSRVKRVYKNADWLTSKYSITPRQWVDWLCLVGGKNDVPGCPGIGKETAGPLLNAYQDVDGIHKAAEMLKPKQREGILEWWPSYPECRRYHLIERDVPVGWNWKTV